MRWIDSPQLLLRHARRSFLLALWLSAIGASFASPSTGKVICIDPGHPSETSRGTHGPSGLTENHVNWVIALRLKTYLQASGLRVVLTKHWANERVTNRHRAEIANAAGAALFLRLHCDAGSGSGTAVYYPDRPGRSQGKTGPSESVIRASRRAALRFHPALMTVIGGSFPDRGIMGDSRTHVGRQQGALTGSVFTQVPALTVEMCVLTNPKDERLVSTEKGRDLLARGLAQGVLATLSSESKPPPE